MSQRAGGSDPAGFTFPCTLPVKVMGTASGEFEPEVLEIVRRHVGDVRPEQVGRRHSRNGRYLSLTIDVEAQSREQLDALYCALSDSPRVAVVL